MARFGSLLAAAVGGMVGSLVRWGLLSASPSDRAELVIFGLNVVASALLGVVLGAKEQIGDVRLELIGTGFAGGLSTFATFAVALAGRIENGELLAAMPNLIGTMGTTVVVAGLGYRLSRIQQTRWMARSARPAR